LWDNNTVVPLPIRLPVTSVTAPLPYSGYHTGRESSKDVQRELTNGRTTPISGPIPPGCEIGGQSARRDPNDFT